MSHSWAQVEVEATVTSYFEMLELELEGRSFNKTEYRRHLLRFLNDRSEGAIERKHQNISAILIDAGKPFIDGYKPLFNYQDLLQEVVLDRWAASSMLQALAMRVVDSATAIPVIADILSALEPPPSLARENKSRRIKDKPKVVSGIDYLGREARNRDLGWAGELFVMRFEQARLIRAGKDQLAN